MLYKFGGFWFDATILNLRPLPLTQYLTQSTIWSINHNSKQKEYYWGKVYPVTYTTFLIGARKGSIVMKTCVEFFNEYYNKYDCAIDYFLNDYILILCMKYHIEDDSLEKIPFIKESPFALMDNISLNKQIKLDDYIFCPQKLDWRNKKAEEIIDGFLNNDN